MHAHRPTGRATLGAGALVVFLLATGSARADIVFGFEDQTATSRFNPTSRPGAYTSLTETVSGLTLTLTRQGVTSPGTFDIFDTTSSPGSFPSVWGTRTLDPFSAETSNTAFVASFSSPISSFSLQYGDFGVDTDTATIMAFSGTDGTENLLASNTDTYDSSLTLPGDVHTFGVTAQGIRSIVFIGGSSGFPNSVYYDNLTVTVSPTAIPEPASLTLLGLGAAGLALRSWRRRAAA
jgi:hypothetical protein